MCVFPISFLLLFRFGIKQLSARNTQKKQDQNFLVPQGRKEKNIIMIVIIISYHQDGVVYGGGGR